MEGKIIAYLRVSTGGQDLDNQKLALLDYAHIKKLNIDHFIETEISTRKKNQALELTSHIESFNKGDLLIVSELSRVGRSLASIIATIDTLIKQGVYFIAVKESIEIREKQDMQTKMLITLFGLFAEIERDLISQRTKEGLANAKKKGKKLGRPKGTKGKSKLDGKELEIASYLDLGISKASIAKLLKVSPTTLKHFIDTRKLAPSSLLKTMK